MSDAPIKRPDFPYALGLDGMQKKAAQTASWLAKRYSLPPEHYTLVESVALGVIIFNEAMYLHAYPTRLQAPSHDVIVSVCNEVFGEQFLIRVALERQIVDTTVRFTKRLSLLIVETVVAQLSAIEPERKREEVALCLLQSKAEVFPTRFASWLAEYEQEQELKKYTDKGL